MRPSLLNFISFLLLFCTFYQGDLKANQECVSITSSVVCEELPDDLFLPTMEYPCYAPDWVYSYNITQTTATWSWDACYGATSYTVQWRYPGGSWYTLQLCYQTWVNVINLQPCTSYEWRVRANCSYGNSSWCYPDVFTTICNYCEVPYGCYTNNIHDSYATFHWAQIPGAQGYDVQIRLPNGSWSYISGSPCLNNYITAHNLHPGTSYEWRVRARCGYNHYSYWTYAVYFTTIGSPYCNYPGWLQCYNISSYTATWNWAPVYGAHYYWVQWRYPGGSWYDLSGGPFYGTSVHVNHLQPCTTYEFRVRTHCSYGPGNSWCNPYTFTTSCHSCPLPTNLITKDIGDHTATFKWSPAYGATSYSVQLRDPHGNWYDVPGSPTNGTWITVGNLHSCKTYEWRVRANCHYYSSSSWSSPKYFITKCGHGCNPPEWVYTAGINASAATMHWAPVSGADYYVVEWRLPGGQWIESGPWTNSWATISNLHPGTNYEWRVKAHCHVGVFSGWSSVTYFTTASVSTCGMPFFRWTLPVTNSDATFNWSAVPGALNYTVQIRLVNGHWQDVAGSPTTGTSITATGLTTNTQYEWRMQVNCIDGTYSPWLSSILFHTGTTPGCGTPGSLFADNLTLTSATLNWAQVQGAVSYSVEIRLVPHGAWNPVVGNPVDTNFIVVDGLSPFTTYEWRVRAHCGAGTHSFVSAAVQFTTTNIPTCNPPAGLTSSGITETTASLSWNAVPGALGYHVQTRLPNGTWIDHPGGVVHDTTVFATGFTPNTTYEWRVRSECSPAQFSNWSATATISTTGTGPTNMDCSSAMLLTVETSCVTTFASNIGSTASVPPPVGGCWTNGYRDVWFKFSMPDVANPAVTIRTTAGSLANAVMEVYTGTDCSIMSLIACEDNNDNGNGSSMPVINLTGTPNATIWVRVWGFDGSAGTFSICVFDHISVNYAEIIDAEIPDAGESLIEKEAFDDLAVEYGTLPEMRISPNPVSDHLNVVVRQTKESRVIGVRMLDLSGKTILLQDVEPVDESEYKGILDVSAFAPGIYVLQVQTTSGMMAEKVSVVK